ncbi:MAG TPA: histidine kinase [Puia sp.]|nr:histidine kinase [Puia sp.]
MAYWIIVTYVFLYDRSYMIYKINLPNFLVCAVVRMALLIGIACANTYWLVPVYLLKKRYGRYFLGVALLIIGYLALQSMYDIYLYGYVLGPGRNHFVADSILYNLTHTSWYLVLSVAFKLSIDWYEQQQVLQRTTIEKLQTEVNYLRSQVNPHFLFNALNNLYALTLQKSDLAPNVVLKLSAIMEYMLYESDAAFVPLEKEVLYLSNFLELEKLRQGAETDIQLHVEGDTGKCMIPPFLLLPLVENAFKHGISRALDNAYLHIDIGVKEGTEIRIANNKPPLPVFKKNGGIGLSNLQKRLDLLYPGKHLLTIDETTDRYVVLLKLPSAC